MIPVEHCHEYSLVQDTKKRFQSVVLVGMTSEISKTTYTSVWIAQDTMESRVTCTAYYDLLQLTAARAVDVSPVTILPSPHSVRLPSVPLHPGRLTHGVSGSALTLVIEAPEQSSQ